MGWSDLEVKPSEVMGHAENLLTDRHSGGFDSARITREREDIARGHLETALMQKGDLAQYVDDAGGPDALLNEMQENATLQPRLEQGIALAFLAKFAGDDAVIPSGRTAEREKGFQDELENWAAAFGRIAAQVLGYTDTASEGFGGGLSNTYDRYD
jgi:hypothetical protein